MEASSDVQHTSSCGYKHTYFISTQASDPGSYFAALANAESADAAASAFRDICEACGSRLVPHLDALMQLYQKVQSAGALAASSNESSLDEESVQQVGPKHVHCLWKPARASRPCEPKFGGFTVLICPLQEQPFAALKDFAARPFKMVDLMRFMFF